MRVGRAVVAVGDQDAAIDWYGRALGFAVLFDGEAFPGFRATHVGPGAAAEPGVWLMPRPRDGATTDDGGAGGHEEAEPLLVLFSDDLDADAERLVRSGAPPHRGPEGAPGSRSLHVRDPWGNVIVVVETPRE